MGFLARAALAFGGGRACQGVEGVCNIIGQSVVHELLLLRRPNRHGPQSRFASGSIPDAHAVPFNVNHKQAEEAQKRHHTRHFFQAVPLMPYKVKDAFLPFWAFTATVETEVHSVNVTYNHVTMGRDGRLKTQSRTTNVWFGQRLPSATYSELDENMQVPAVKKYFASDLRRMRAGAQLAQARTISPSMLDSEVCGTRRVGAFEVLARDALDAAQRWLWREEGRRAEAFAANRISGSYSSLSVNMEMRLLAVQQRPVYIPVYVFSHRYTVSGISTKLRTFVSGFDPERTSGTQVLNPLKVAAAAGASVGVTALALGSAGSLWELGLLYGALPAIASGYAALYWPVGVDLWNKQMVRWQKQLQDILTRAALNQQQSGYGSRGRGSSSSSQHQWQQQPGASANRQADPRGLYSALGVECDASADEIKAAFRGLALKFHPDRVTNPDDKEKMSAKFKEISQAYQVLRNQQRRALYDSTGMVD